MALKTTDITPQFKEKYFIEAKDLLKNLHECTLTYVAMDNLYDIEGLERLKRDMTGYLEALGTHYAHVKKYKTMGDYLEEARKKCKAETIQFIIGENTKKTSENQAEKIVYAHPKYIETMEMITHIRGFFIKVENQYNSYTNTLNNIKQSIAICRKDPNFKPVEDDSQEED